MSVSGYQPHSRRLYVIAAVIVVVAVIVIAVLFIRRYVLLKEESARRTNALNAGPHVQVTIAKRAPGARKLALSGEARPYASVTLFPKVSGYLRRIAVDKGDRVKAGQLVAVLESPELESQYRGAVVEARNKRVFAARAATLVTTESIAIQDAQNAEAAARVAEATAASLKTQKGYLVVRAPFTGTVTARFVDPGALLQTAASSQSSAQPIVTVSRIDRLRVYIYLDQKNAALVKLGDRAMVADAARPGHEVPGRISRISGELDVKTRTMLVELDVDNRKEELLAGGFVQVALTLAMPPGVEVPVEALRLDDDVTKVAVVGAGNRVALRQVTVAESDGKMARLEGGVAEGETVILHPGVGLAAGTLVQPVKAGQ